VDSTHGHAVCSTRSLYENCTVAIAQYGGVHARLPRPRARARRRCPPLPRASPSFFYTRASTSGMSISLRLHECWLIHMRWSRSSAVPSSRPSFFGFGPMPASEPLPPSHVRLPTPGASFSYFCTRTLPRSAMRGPTFSSDSFASDSFLAARADSHSLQVRSRQGIGEAEGHDTLRRLRSRRVCLPSR